MSGSQTKRQGSQCVTVTLPELLQQANRAKQLSLSALRSNIEAGNRASRFMGRGMVYAESRLYQPGDDIRTIDWRVTARTGKTHTKLFNVEKERQVLIGVDMRSPMFFATQGVFKSVQAALMMSSIAWNSVQGGDRLGGIVFEDDNLYEFRPALGKKSILPLLQSLADSSAYRDKIGRLSGPDPLDRAIERLARVAVPGGIVFLASDFRYFSQNAQETLLKLSRHTDICLCFIYDPFEAELPESGIYSVTDKKTEMHLNAGDRECSEIYRRQFLERRRQVRLAALHRHIHFMECSTSQDYFEMLKTRFAKSGRR